MSEYCEVINVIPQTSTTCWFNAILMSCLYSQGASRVFRETALRDDWEKSDDPLKIALFNILSFINRIKLFPHLREEQKKLYQDYLANVRPEHLVLKIAETNEELKKVFKYFSKTQIFLGYYIYFLIDFLKLLGISHRCINIINNRFRIDELDEEIPEIILLFYPEIFIVENPYDETYKPLLKEEDLFKIRSDYEILYFKGETYKLDSVLLSNYIDDSSIKHLISGFSCGNKRYVYNGWITKLFKFDWKLNSHEPICVRQKETTLLNKKTKLKKDDYCFSFNKGERIPIYVRVRNDVDTELRTRIKRLNFNVKSIKRKIFEGKDETIKSAVSIKSVKSMKDELNKLKDKLTDFDVIDKLDKDLLFKLFKLIYDEEEDIDKTKKDDVRYIEGIRGELFMIFKSLEDYEFYQILEGLNEEDLRKII